MNDTPSPMLFRNNGPLSKSGCHKLTINSGPNCLHMKHNRVYAFGKFGGRGSTKPNFDIIHYHHRLFFYKKKQLTHKMGSQLNFGRPSFC